VTRLVLCSHGTRSRVGAARVSELVAAVAHALPLVDVREAHVDVHPPFLDDVITRGAVVVPLLLAPGHHVHADIFRAALGVNAHVTSPLGPDKVLTSLLAARLARLEDLGCGQPLNPADLVVLAAAGSSVPGSVRATREVARRLAAELGRPVRVGYGAACTPRLNDLVAQLRISHPGRRIVAASYLLAPGHFHDRVLACGADDVTAPLLDSNAPDARLVELVIRRAAVSGTSTPLPGLLQDA
jgi:sirohydrochlorin ferrochelatase